MRAVNSGILLVLVLLARFGEARFTFVKTTSLNYPGNTYYTIRNVSLQECHRWCREELSCVAASFAYTLDPRDATPETTCHLQNETQASKPNVQPKQWVDTYYLTKVHIRSENVCDRLWSFERVPNKLLRGLDNAIIFTSDLPSCLTACLNEVRFVCRSVEFNYVTLQCHLSEFDRRSPGANVYLTDSQAVDYFENTCLQHDKVCPGSKHYSYVQTGLPQAAITHFVHSTFYPDKQIIVNSRQDCLRRCTYETSFICRSVLYRPQPAKAICYLYHVDHISFPGGINIFDSAPSTPLRTNPGSRENLGFYLEAGCGDGSTHPPPVKGPVIQHASQGSTPKTSAVVDGESDPSCDAYGVCYDVSIQCTDAAIIMMIRTNRPFHGRVYALGRSETCNTHVHETQSFRLDISLSGQDCNTQSLAGVYSNTVVLQHHNVVLTKADKMYNVRCTYETTSRNVSFGMIPVRDPDTMQVTAAPEAPAPKIAIFGLDGREANTVRIGDRLTFQIQIPDNTPYGIFARSCIAMAKDSRSTFEIVDERGCPVDPHIFPRFNQIGNSLESSYEAFRFTESYGVIFQCNVKYCIGPCEPAICGHTLGRQESWGRKKRSTSQEKRPDEMTLSREILVLDFGDESPARSTQEKPFAANESFSLHDSVTFLENCASKTLVMTLSVTSCLLLVIYVCTVAYFVAQKRAMKTLH